MRINLGESRRNGVQRPAGSTAGPRGARFPDGAPGVVYQASVHHSSRTCRHPQRNRHQVRRM